MSNPGLMHSGSLRSLMTLVMRSRAYLSAILIVALGSLLLLSASRLVDFQSMADKVTATANSGLGDAGDAAGPVRAGPGEVSEKTYRIGLVQDTAKGWRRRFDIFTQQMKQQVHRDTTYAQGRFFFQNNWEPVITCPYERRLGHFGDGGKWVCNPDDILLDNRNAVVYSLGSLNEFSFEEAVHDILGGKVEIHTFDFGNEISNKPEYVNYHQWGIGAKNEIDPKMQVQFHDIVTITNILGHADKTIDMFKIDVEGAEFDAFFPLLRQGRFPRVEQMQIEVHFKDGAHVEEIHELLLLLRKVAKLEIFHKEANILIGGDLAEFGLVRIDWEKLVDYGIVIQSEYDAGMSAVPRML